MSDPSLDALIEDFKKTGWVFGILGGLGMIARLILTNEKYNTFKWIRMGIAGVIVGIICYFALHETNLDPFYKSILCSISGSYAPELFEYLQRKFLQKGVKNG